MRKCFVIVALILVSLPAPGGEAKGSLKALAPFLDDQVYAVVRVDVAVDPFGKLKDLGFPARDLEEGKKLAAKWREEISQAGGKELFLVWSLADRLGVPFVVIPTKGEDEAKALADALKQNASPGALAKGSGLGDRPVGRDACPCHSARARGAAFLCPFRSSGMAPGAAPRPHRVQCGAPLGARS